MNERLLSFVRPPENLYGVLGIAHYYVSAVRAKRTAPQVAGAGHTLLYERHKSASRQKLRIGASGTAERFLELCEIPIRIPLSLAL